ncbi:MAG TPA: phytoene/squalene synthase family protein [Cytophagaceae bacterium]|jgi:phytoene synthase|nr:phytoene/squalene synthase family protein [Cytophagaceae bacterium]
MKEFYDDVTFKCSKLITNCYSTSFSLGTYFLGKEFRMPVYSIYGFVRFADEIVDTFHNFNKQELLNRFIKDTYQALEEGISLNPVLNSFQLTVRHYQIDRELIDTFLKSMRMDLENKKYNQEGYEEYILGSAEVVGLMCLKIFVRGNEKTYQALKHDAMKLGSAFQKINFLRDLKADYQIMGRTYFPGLEMNQFDEKSKKEIENDIQKDFDAGLRGIRKLSKESRFGVYIAYTYYTSLYKKIKRMPASTILNQRIRITDGRKYLLFIGCLIKHKLNLI